MPIYISHICLFVFGTCSQKNLCQLSTNKNRTGTAMVSSSSPTRSTQLALAASWWACMRRSSPALNSGRRQIRYHTSSTAAQYTAAAPAGRPPSASQIVDESEMGGARAYGHCARPGAAMQTHVPPLRGAARGRDLLEYDLPFMNGGECERPPFDLSGHL